MSVIPCEQNAELKTKILEFAEVLKTQSHQLGEHGLTENEFYNSGLFRGAVERIRGQFSATMSEKRDFVRHILNHMQDGGFIQDWNSSGADNRHDYAVTMMHYIVYLCYAVAGIVVIVSALQIYIKMKTGEEGVKKNIMMLVGACLFLIGATIVFPAFFGYQI